MLQPDSWRYSRNYGYQLCITPTAQCPADYTYGGGRTRRKTKYPCFMRISIPITQTPPISTPIMWSAGIMDSACNIHSSEQGRELLSHLRSVVVNQSTVVIKGYCVFFRSLNQFWLIICAIKNHMSTRIISSEMLATLSSVMLEPTWYQEKRVKMKGQSRIVNLPKLIPAVTCLWIYLPKCQFGK